MNIEDKPDTHDIDAQAQAGDVLVVELRPVPYMFPQVPLAVRWRRLLKFALRSCGLKASWPTPSPGSDILADREYRKIVRQSARLAAMPHHAPLSPTPATIEAQDGQVHPPAQRLPSVAAVDVFDVLEGRPQPGDGRRTDKPP